MCFSAEASLATFLIGTIGAAFVYSLGTASDHIIALFLGYVALMQGIEYILWNHQTCDSFHKQVSVAGMLLNSYQPIVFGLLLLLFNTRLTYKLPIIIIMISSVLYSINYLLKYKDNLQCTTPQPNDPHLVWNWTVMDSYEHMWFLYITVFVVIAMLGMPTLRGSFSISIAMITGMITSILVYPRQDVGALWCFFATFTPPIYYIFRKLGLAII
jgi:hypothetical protein